MASRRIPYSGVDYVLSERLKDALKPLDCFGVRSPVFTARTLSHRRHTPVIIVKKSQGFGELLDTIRRRLGTIRGT
ncbi:MAG: hypothetical protein ABW250_20580 [Pyrinomonadaceae bacterium]